MVGESAELQIVGSESVSEAAKYVRKSGDEMDRDDNVGWLIDSRDTFQYIWKFWWWVICPNMKFLVFKNIELKYFSCKIAFYLIAVIDLYFLLRTLK